MSQDTIQKKAVEELQWLGLREYEAKCFVALIGMPSGTARDVSEQIDVPRTRVYEAARSLESQGLVEIQHSTPQQFRAVEVTEAVQLLDKQRQSRIEALGQSLGAIEQQSTTPEVEEPEIWALTDSMAIETRTEQLIDRAEREILLLLGKEQALWEGLAEQVTAALDGGVDVVVGTASESVQSQLAESLPEGVVYESDLGWLDPAELSTASVGRLLLVDESTLLASTLVHSNGETQERAVCGTGTNGLAVVFRRLLRHEFGLSARGG